MVTFLPVPTVRAILKRQGMDANAHLKQFCIDPDLGLFIKGVILPLRPAEVLDAMAAVGVRATVNIRKSSPRRR
jgi:hydrogenase/urease accessory protein HupE